MESKQCWCCGEVLFSYPERLDGVCLNCHLDSFPLLDITEEGRAAADLYREAERLVLSVSQIPKPEPEPEIWQGW